MYFDGGGEDSSFYSVQSGGSGGGGGYRTGALRGVEGRGSRGGAASYSPSLSPTNSESRAAQRGLFDHHSGTSTSLYLASLPPLVVCVKHVCWRKKDWNFPSNLDWRPRPCSRLSRSKIGDVWCALI